MPTAKHTYKILITDLIGMIFDADGQPDHSEVQHHIEAKGGVFHLGSQALCESFEIGKLHFFYQPDLSTEAELLAETAAAQYDAVIAAATFLPPACQFKLGGVRIGAGTGNMASLSWGGANGVERHNTEGAPLMNTPSFNSQATAQMAIKALLRVLPDLDVDTLHQRVVAGDFDTGKHLSQYPTETIASKTIAVLGYGNIGREVAKLAKALGMRVVIFARARHQPWICSEGFEFAPTIIAAATGADVISPHLGLGALDSQTGCYANAGVIDDEVLTAMNSAAVVINYDRGELVDIAALDRALSSGQVRYAAIDADLFKDSLLTDKGGELSGPMKAYLDIYPAHVGKMSLLPHAAADTEHHARVAGAKQAVEQIFAAIVERKVINLKGQLPAGFTNGKAATVKGVGSVTAQTFDSLDAAAVKQIGDISGALASFWAADNPRTNSQARADATKNANQLLSLLADKGLLGPYIDG